MKARNLTLMLAALALGLSAAAAYAVTPDINSAILIPRVWDDCPTSTLTSGNSYPSHIFFDDAQVNCGGYANLHVWRLSGDGVTAALFPNDCNFSIAADLMISGVTEAEAGLQIRPWWSEADGRFNVRSTDGEIACFGGRLPFFSFTATYGLLYVKGTTIHIEMIYRANGLNENDPGTIEYNVTYNNLFYASGALPFDQGNPNEPQYGFYGILENAQVGGHVQIFLAAGNPDAQCRADWNNIVFTDLTPIPVQQTSWGQIKNLYAR
jgi:hypothetical protein